MVVFGLARDGCLVRSWFGVAQRGGAAGRRASAVCCTVTNKGNCQQPRSRGVGVLFLSLIEKTGKILTKKTGKIYTHSIKIKLIKSML